MPSVIYLLIACLFAAGCADVVGAEGAKDAGKSSAQPGLTRFRDGAFSAVRMGELEALKAFVKQDPAVLHKLSGGDNTLLHLAAEENRPEVIEYLVAKGLDVNARNGLGLTPLHRAAVRGSLEAAKTLVRLGADPKARMQFPRPKLSPGQSVLAAAAQGGHPELVKFLLDQGAPIVYGEADWKKPGSPKGTALHWAALASTDWSDPRQATDRLAVVDLLAKRIGDINTTATGAFNGGTVLHVAASQHQPPIVRYLLENYPDIDIDAEDIYGKTPHMLALAADPAGAPVAVRRAKEEAREAAQLLREAYGKRRDATPLANTDGEASQAADTDLTAPVFYQDELLVLVTTDGVAAVKFGEPSEREPVVQEINAGPAGRRVTKLNRYHEVPYRYRFLSADGTGERAGEGKVFQREPLFEENGHAIEGTGAVDIWIEAGPIKLKWSKNNRDSGWIYYRPEETAVLVTKQGILEIEHLNLSRFRSLPRPTQDSPPEEDQ